VTIEQSIQKEHKHIFNLKYLKSTCPIYYQISRNETPNSDAFGLYFDN